MLTGSLFEKFLSDFFVKYNNQPTYSYDISMYQQSNFYVSLVYNITNKIEKQISNWQTTRFRL